MRDSIAMLHDERERLKHVVFKQVDDKEIVLFLLQRKITEIEQIIKSKSS